MNDLFNQQKNRKIIEDETLLTAKHLCKTYKEGNLITDVLKDVTFEIKPKSLLAIIGSSGSGKSTLLHLLGGLDTPTAGEIIFQSKNMNLLSESEKAKLRNQKIGFVYQFHHLLPDFTALENIAMPLLIGGVKVNEAKDRAMAMLESVNLVKRAKHRSSEMSGGERQRVAIGRALINRPALVMADEPTGNLDQATADSIFELLIKLNSEQGTAFLVVTHDLTLANKMDRQLIMRDGQLRSTADESLDEVKN